LERRIGVNRRTFVKGAVALAAAPRVAEAQPARRVFRVGVLVGIRPSFNPASNPTDRELVDGLREHGYVLGRNLTIEFRSANSQPERMSALAVELVALRVDVMVTQSTGPTLAAKQATSTIPIVMFGVADPVKVGIVDSLARPGGNVTGLAVNSEEIAAKRIQLLQEAVPKLSRVAVLWNATFPAMALGFQEIERSAPALGVTVQSIRVTGSQDFDAAFAAITRGQAGGLIVLYGPLRGTDHPRLVEFVTRQRLPSVFEPQIGVKEGGLLAFGSSFPTLARRACAYVDKILNGTRPADLPVEEPTHFDLAINLKTARALGLSIPPSLLLRADEVIE
jgi:putative ABC transport system substrate-binding protein